MSYTISYSNTIIAIHCSILQCLYGILWTVPRQATQARDLKVRPKRSKRSLTAPCIVAWPGLCGGGLRREARHLPSEGFVKIYKIFIKVQHCLTLYNIIQRCSTVLYVVRCFFGKKNKKPRRQSGPKEKQDRVDQQRMEEKISK